MAYRMKANPHPAAAGGLHSKPHWQLPGCERSPACERAPVRRRVVEVAFDADDGVFEDVVDALSEITGDSSRSWVDAVYGDIQVAGTSFGDEAPVCSGDEDGRVHVGGSSSAPGPFDGQTQLWTVVRMAWRGRWYVAPLGTPAPE